MYFGFTKFYTPFYRRFILRVRSTRFVIFHFFNVFTYETCFYMQNGVYLYDNTWDISRIDFFLLLNVHSAYSAALVDQLS